MAVFYCLKILETLGVIGVSGIDICTAINATTKAVAIANRQI